MTTDNNAKNEAADGSWFLRGAAGERKKKANDAVNAMRREKQVHRFRLKPGESGKIVFVDDEGWYINEHNLKIGSRFGNYLTCTRDFKSCPVCEQTKKNPTFTAYYTIIDTRQFTRKSDNKVVKNRKILFPAKGEVQEILQRLKERNGGSLVGLPLEVSRLGSNPKAPNTGSQFDVLGKRINIAAKLGAEAAEPHDYMKITAPPTLEELEGFGIYEVSTVGSSDDLGLDAEVSEAKETEVSDEDLFAEDTVDDTVSEVAGEESSSEEASSTTSDNSTDSTDDASEEVDIFEGDGGSATGDVDDIFG